jgi:vitamin B12 transporter
MEPLLVTATRTAKPLAETAAQAIIITRDEIDSGSSLNLLDLLQQRAGVEIRSNGGPGQTSNVFIRGANGTHTLVLIDGQRIASSTSGTAAFENIPLALIERIEIVKGPRSGLYGSDAIGGVIQIFTRRSDRNAGYVTIGGGSFSTRAASAGLSASFNDTSLTLSGGTQKIDAPSATSAAAGTFTFNPDRDPYENTNGKFGVSHRLDSNNQLAFDAWQSSGKTNFDGGPGDTETVNRQILSGVALRSDNQFLGRWKSRLSAGLSTDDSRVRSSFPGEFRTRQKLFGWQNDIALGSGEVSVGLERRDENVRSTTQYTAQSRSTDSVFAATSQKFGAFALAGNVRRDQENQFGGRTTGGASLGFQLTAAQRIYLSGANAFRAPSFNDLYFPGFSNPLLQPEKSHAGEIGWRFTSRDVRASVAAFDNHIDNLIAFDFATSRPQNIQRARIRGVEAGVSTTLAGIDWRLDVTAQDAKNTITDKRLRGRSKVFGSLGAGQTWGKWQWRADVVANDARFDSANEAAASRLGGYALLNASVRYAIDPRWKIELVGNNLTDRHYALARGYEPLGRYLLFNVRFDSK